MKHYYPEEGRASFEDTVFDAIGEQGVGREEEIFLSLPDEVKFIAYQWGLSDTPFRDETHTFLEENMNNKNWKQYKRKGLSEMRPYVEGEDVSHVSISDADFKNGSPKKGDMIARNPKNHEDQWLVAKKYFEDNLEPI